PQARRHAQRSQADQQVPRRAPAARRGGSSPMKRKLPEPLDLRPWRDLSLREPPHKTTLADFREPAPAGASVAQLLDSLPDFLGARSLRELAGVIAGRPSHGTPQ